MTAVPVALLERPPVNAPEVEQAPQTGTPPIGPDEIEVVFDTDTLITACNCSSSSDNPYQ